MGFRVIQVVSLLAAYAAAAPHEFVKRQPSTGGTRTGTQTTATTGATKATVAQKAVVTNEKALEVTAKATGASVISVQNKAALPTLSGWDYSNPSVAFPASGTWTAVQCDATGLVSTQNGGIQQWEAADAGDAWKQTLAAWNTPNARTLPTGQDMTFSDFVWNVFHSTPGCNCQDILNAVCQTSLRCDYGQKAVPAASLIMNSMVFLHEAVNTAFSVIDQAKNSFDITGFVNTFAAPITQKDITIGKEIVDIVTLASVVTIAGSINFMFKPAAEAKGVSEEVKGSIADLSYGVAGYAASAAKDDFPTPDGPGLETFFDSAIAYLYNTTKQQEADYLLGIMGAGNQENQTQLTNMMNGGTLLDLEHQSPTYSQDLTHNMSKLITGALIPVAWAISPQGFQPFILQIPKDDFDCKNTDKGQALPGEKGYAIGTVFEDDSYKSTRWSTATFGALAGGDTKTLDGTSYQGIEIQDFVVSSYAGFLQNGKKNGFSAQNTSGLTANDDFTVTPPPDNQALLPFQAGLRTPGFYNLTICLDWREAYNTLEQKATQTGDNVIQAMPICGTYPSTNVKVGKVSDFTPGTCKVTVEQFQRNEPSTNPTNNYETQVTISGENGGVYGSSAKQDSSSPLIIADSNLPYQLIVKVDTDKGDGSAVEFWYSDQWWTSNDQAHKCDFAGYKEGSHSRTGTCNFDCKAPPATSQTIASATKAAPTDAVTASPGPQTLSANLAPTITASGGGGSATGTGTASQPTSTGDFTGGNCTMHIQEWQRNEKDVNPSNDYAVEVTIKDGNGKLVVDSGQISAPANQWVDINGGGLPHPLAVKTGYGDDKADPPPRTGKGFDEQGDNYPLRCSYGPDGLDQLFNVTGRSPGHVGKYDHGVRAMDSWFKC